MSEFVPTQHQQAIAEVVRKGEKNVAINAGAGSGKTSTLLWLIETVIPQTSKVLMCVFNTRNKDEISGKLKKRGISNASAKTFNGMAYSAFIKRYGIKDTTRDMELDSNKYAKLIRWWMSRHFTDGSRTTEQLNDIRDWMKGALHLFMVNTTRNHQNGDLVLFVGGSLRESYSIIPHAVDAESVMEVTNRYPLPDLERADDYDTCLSGIGELLRVGKLCFENPRAAAALLGVDSKDRPINQSVVDGKVWVDFADQVYWCVVDQWNVWQTPIVLVDEAQDLSPLQRAIVNMHVYGRGRVIMVGDPQQAINAWNGADNDGFGNSLAFWYVPKVNTLDLPICFRCFKEICELASDWKPGFTAAPNAISGEIATINNADLPKLVKEGDALIGRTRAACVQWYRELVKQGLPVRLHGINPAESITRTLETVSNRTGFDYATLRDCIREYSDDKLKRMTTRGKSETEIENFQDDINCVLEYLDTIDLPRSFDELLDKVITDFTPRTADGGIFIMTGHGSKGGEWNKVFNITPDRFPTIRATSKPEDIIQEKNLRYVVQTRAMQAYYLVTKDAPSYFQQPVKPATLPVAPVVVKHDDLTVVPQKPQLPVPSAPVIAPVVVTEVDVPAPQPEPVTASAKPTSPFTADFLRNLPRANPMTMLPALKDTIIHAKLYNPDGVIWLVSEYDMIYREFWCLAYDPKYPSASEWAYIQLEALETLGNVQRDMNWTPRPFFDVVVQECPCSAFVDAVVKHDLPAALPPPSVSPIGEKFPPVRPIGSGIASGKPEERLTAGKPSPALAQALNHLSALNYADLEQLQAAIFAQLKAQKVSA